MNRREFLATGSAVTLGGLTGCLDSLRGETEPLTVSGSWPRPEYDHYSSGSHPNIVGPEEKPAVQWDEQAPVDSEHVPAVVVADETVFFAGGSRVTAFDATDGTERWQRQVADEQHPGAGWERHCSVTVADEQVFVGTHEGLTALTTDGEERWSHDVPVQPGHSGVFRSPAVAHEMVYFCTADERTVHAYSLDGSERWAYECESPLIGAPAVGEESVFIAEARGPLRALTIEGEPRWTNPLRDGGTPHPVSPTVFEDRVIAVGYDDEDQVLLGAYHVDTGDAIWTNDRGPSIVGSPAVLERGSRRELACPTWLGTVFFVDIVDGSLLWGAPVTDGVTSTVPSAVADEQSVFVAGDGGVARLSPWSDSDWRVEIDRMEGSLAVLDDTLFAGSSNGRCYALA